MGRHSGALRSSHDLCQPLQPMAQGRPLGAYSASCFSCLRWRCADDRLFVALRPPECRQRSKKDHRSRCMGHSRGGRTTNIHALVDAQGRPIRLKLTEGQAHYGRSAIDMFETLEAGHILLADCAYDSDALRNTMAERGAWANIRAMPNRVKTFPFSPWVYRQRNAV